MATQVRSRAELRLRNLVARARVAVRRPVVPDYPEPVRPNDPRTDWLWQLEATRNALEIGRAAIQRDGWTTGGWFSVAAYDGRVRVVGAAEAHGLVRPQAAVAGACTVGTLLRLAEDPDRPTSIRDVRRCVDELFEAVHETLGHTSRPPGQAYSLATRRAHLRAVTAWNDAPGRTRDDVLELFDRAIGRTIIGSCCP
ncbi:MAG: DUF6197 family protein [Propionibacteriaceae bacterium]